MTSPKNHPLILYSLIAFNTKIICEIHEPSVVEGSSSHKEVKYIRACRKILKKIESSEIRRPDGMGTLISGSYSYNYIHGYEYCNNANYPLLESLIFLCVLPLYQSNIASNEREIAFSFLSSIRRDFLMAFANHLKYIFSHINMKSISIRINNLNNDNDNSSFLSVEDQNIFSNMDKLSAIISQRMYGDYQTKFEFNTVCDSHSNSNSNSNSNSDMDIEEQLNSGANSEYGYIDIKTPKSNKALSIINNYKNNEKEVEETELEQYKNIKNTDYGSTSQSKIKVFVDGISMMKQSMQKITKNMSVGSLSSLTGNNNHSFIDDKFVNYENMPLIGGSSTYLSGTNEYDVIHQGFCLRHRKKALIMITLLILVYIIIAVFCGWNFGHCAAH